MGGLFFFGTALEIGLEQIKSQYAGGILLPPVQKLVATMIKSSPVVSTKPLKTNGFQGFFFFRSQSSTSCLHAYFCERHEV